MPCLKIPATMDETQFKNEVRRLRPQLMVAARRHTGDSDCAEDIVQDALLRLWQLHANLHMPIAPLAFVLVRNLAIDTLRRPQTHHACRVETLAMAEPVKEVDARYERIVRLLNKLPTLQQTIFRLRHIEGMEYADIAEITGTTPESVRQTVSRARRTILKLYHSTSCKTNK